MSDISISQEIAVILGAPVVTLVGAAALIGIVWKIVDWAYKLRIEGLKDHIDALRSRLDLANDRLRKSSEELEGLRRELETSRAVPVSVAARIRKIIDDNTSTSASTAGYSIDIFPALGDDKPK